jgi:hypothetical protein
MSTQSHVSGKTSAVLAVIFLIPAIVLFGLWTSLGFRNSDMGAGEKMDTFLAYFPSWMGNIYLIQGISFACCLIAIIMASRSFRKRELSMRLIMLVTVIAAVFILLFNIFLLI